MADIERKKRGEYAADHRGGAIVTLFPIWRRLEAFSTSLLAN
jgi:hypothetical protein